VDIGNYGTWQSAMSAQGWRWFGNADKVHFDYVAGGTDTRSLSVLAFQRLWNHSHPEDKIGEDGSYGPATAARLAKTPGGGLPAGPTCTPPDATADDSSATDDGSGDGTDGTDTTNN
jgi:hypothetical protein